MYKLKEDDIKKLREEPESGMGYQIVEAKVKYNPNPVIAYVFNAELLVPLDELAEINGRVHEDLLQNADEPSSFVFERILPAVIGSPSSEISQFLVNALAPSPQLLRTTIAHEGFVRFSAYADDKRVGADGCLTNGTYATTIGDARFAVSGLAVAGRYALPNPSPAIYAYTIVLPEKIQYRVGTARPANYQSGGGVEVLFNDGAPRGSAFKPYQIPEK
jgi:hypothetical protein